MYYNKLFYFLIIQILDKLLSIFYCYELIVLILVIIISEIIFWSMEGKQQLSLKRIQPTSYVFSKQRQLGKGAYGQVYLGFDEKNKLPVAIKTISYAKLSQEYANRQVLGQKLASQLSNMQLCQSQRLVKLISPHHSSKNMYVVCEYCNGGSLKEYLNKKGQLSEYEGLKLFKDILEGFKCLHATKIVHRDMKPANLLLHNHRIKIGDLGFSKSISVHQQVLKSIVGTPLYMSPQILSNATYTQKTDIWSLGIILYQMLFGEAPWRVNSLQQIKQKIKHKPDFSRNHYISQATKHLILRMLQHDEKKRIDWEELFNQFLNPQTQSMQEQISPFLQKIRQLNQHFFQSLAIQSEQHIVCMLIKNHKKHAEFYTNIETARQFFLKFKQLKKQQTLIQPIVNLYVQNRNTIAYLMKLFMECYENCEQINQPLIFASMLMILKYCIVKTQQMLSNSVQGMQNFQLFLNSTYYFNMKQLLLLDLELCQQLLILFQDELFIPKMKQFASLNSAAVEQIQKNLKPFFGQHSAAVGYTQFWMKNECRQLFNAFKDAQQFSDKWMLIPRMIYEFEKSNKNHTFANYGEKSVIWKKIEAWGQEERWKIKLKQLRKFQIQSFASFINRQVTWKSLNLIGINLPKNDHSMS